MKLNLKERKGITLIALVITIIVLLILAGVSVAMLTGQNGILTQAQSAKTTNTNKSAEEKVKLAVMAARSQSEDASLDLEKLTAEVTTNYGGQVEGGAFPATVTIDGKSFTVDSDGNVELAGSKPQITNAKVTTDATGSTEAANDTAEGTTLYVTFGATLENGTITKVIDNDGNKEMTASNGIYSKAITKNGTYTFTITGTGENGEVTTPNATVQVKKYASKVKVGDFVNYSAGNWTAADMTKIQNSGAKIAANNSTNKPSSNFQFGGFTEGSSKDGNATPYDSSYAYVTDKSTESAVTGWRVFDIDGDSVTLISAGCPEDYYYHPYKAYISEYILSGNTNSSASSDLGLGTDYTARDWSMYVNSSYGSGITATALTKTKYDAWLSKYAGGSTSKIQGNSYESLIDNYSYYWLASAGNSRSLGSWAPSGRGVTYAYDGIAFGVRVLVSLPSGISTSEPVGTKTVTSRGADYTYNVWNIN